MYIKNLINNKQFVFFFLLLICLPALFFLLRPGFPQTDDGNWMVVRFSAFYQTLRDGQIPPRFLGRLNHEYGYPVANFLYPGFLYLGVPIKALGVGFMNTIKILIGLSFIFSSYFTYEWLRKRFSHIASLVGTVFFLYFPYRLFDLYTRGSVGELVGFGVLPVVFWSIETNKKFVFTFSFALLLLSHNTFAFIVTPVILLYIWLAKKKNLFYYIGLSCLLDAFFIIPALYDLQYTQFKNTEILKWQDYFLSMETVGLFGLTGVSLMLLSAYALLKKRNNFLVLFFIFFVLGLFFSSVYSQIFWTIGLFPKVVQFPWRFLILSVVASPFLAAYCYDHVSKSKFLLGSSLIILLLISTFSYLSPKVIADYEDGFYLTNEDSTTVRNEYMPIWVKDFQTKKPESFFTLEGENITGEVVRQNNREIIIQTHSLNNSILTINKVFFPGWKVLINNHEVPISYEKNGLLQVKVPNGESTVIAYFSETPIRVLADCLTGVAVALIAFMFAQSLMTKKTKHVRI